MLESIMIILLFFILSVILIDIVPLFKDWISRIHIGKYPDKSEWKNSVQNTAVKWLNKTPKIKITDNSRLVILDIIRGNYSKSTVQYWQEAGLVLGIGEYLKDNPNIKIEKEINIFLKKKFNNSGQWIEKPLEVDAAILAYSILKLDFIDPDKYKNAFDYVWNLIKDHIGEDKTVGYRKSMQNYRYVDTIGFICPFLIAYGKRYNKSECIELAIKQIKVFEKYGMLDKTFIPCHAYKINEELPLGLYGWGRGLGWFGIGLIDSWNELPSDNPNNYLLTEMVTRYAKSIMQFQNENGSWSWAVTRSESRPDSSVTATLAYFLINASRIRSIEKECTNSCNVALDFLKGVTRRNGAVDFSQGDTKDIGVYSILFNILPFTQGFCLRTILLKENSKTTHEECYKEAISIR